jgi:hypothetical protein
MGIYREPRAMKSGFRGLSGAVSSARSLDRCILTRTEASDCCKENIMRDWARVGLTVLLMGLFSLMWAQQPKTVPKLSITLASEPWILAFEAKDFAVDKNELQPDGRAYLLAENQKTNITLSVYLEKVSGTATEGDCDETQKQRLAEDVEYKREMVATKKSAGMTILEYTIPEFQGVPVQQRNLFACLPKDDVYVDIHLSKITFKPQEEKLFTDVLDSLHFIQKP